MSGARKVHIKSYGCQMNVYDSHRMADTLAAEGFSETTRVEDADVVILNTCHIRERAAEKVYSELGRVRQIKQAAARDGRRVAVAVAGCVAQAEGKEIIRRANVVDIVVGPQSYHRLPALLERVARGETVIDTEFPVEDKFGALKAPTRDAIRSRGISAFVTVQEGCDKFCTFCVVPYTRGIEVSRPVTSIVAEVERLADAGVREVAVIGQNVNAYHDDGADGRSWTLGRLLYRLADVPGIVRLRYTTSHPCDMDDSLVAAHRDLPSLPPFLHLPVQSGSDRILAAMNRRHTRVDYLERRHDIVGRRQHIGQPDARPHQLFPKHEGKLDLDARPAIARMLHLGAVGNDHVVVQIAEVGLVDVGRALHRLRGEPHLVTNQLAPRRDPALVHDGRDRIGILDRDAGIGCR